MKITIPELSLIALIGPTGSGKSTFAKKYFKPTEVLSSDYCRGLVSDDENSQVATNDAFEILHFIARKRLAAGRLTVIDATNVQPEARKPLVALAREDGLVSTETGRVTEAVLESIHLTKRLKDVVDWPPSERHGCEKRYDAPKRNHM